MDSYVFIDGIVLWIILAIFLFIFFGFVYMCLKNSEIEKKNLKLKRENEKLREEVVLWKDKHYRATYKTPEVE